MVHRCCPLGKVVGVMTVDASSLTPDDFAGAGITSDMAMAIAGLETEKRIYPRPTRQSDWSWTLKRRVGNISESRNGCVPSILLLAPWCSNAPICRRTGPIFKLRQAWPCSISCTWCRWSTPRWATAFRRGRRCRCRAIDKTWFVGCRLSSQGTRSEPSYGC